MHSYTDDDFLGQPAGGSGKSIAKWIGSMPPGTTLTGVVFRKINPATDVQLQTIPGSNPPVPVPPYRDGRQKTNLTIPLQLQQPYPPDVFKDGRASWIVSIKDYREQVLPAMVQAGVQVPDENGKTPFPEEGAVMSITFAGDRQVQGPQGPVIKKQKTCTYQRPAGAQDGQAPQQAQAPQATQPNGQYNPQAAAPPQPQPPQYAAPQQPQLPTTPGAPPYQGAPPAPMPPSPYQAPATPAAPQNGAGYTQYQAPAAPGPYQAPTAPPQAQAGPAPLPPDKDQLFADLRSGQQQQAPPPATA